MIDLARLPSPQVVDVPDYDTIRADLVADYTARYPDFTALLASDPVIKLIDAVAYLSLLHRQRVNDAARAVMLAFAEGGDLDHLAALLDVARLAGETDMALRARVQQAPHGFSTAGAGAAYRYHAMRAHPDIREAGIDSPVAGLVRVTILSRQGDGTPAQAVLDAVAAVLLDDDVRPLTDRVSVVGADIIPYDVTARLEIQSPDPAAVVATAETAARAYMDRQHALKGVVATSGLIAALHVPGVRRVFLDDPATDLVCGANQAAWCRSILLTVAGTI